MNRRAGRGRVALLLVAAVVVAWGASTLRRHPAPAPSANGFPRDGLRFAARGDGLRGSLEALARHDVYSQVLRPREALAAADVSGPGMLALYGTGWLTQAPSNDDRVRAVVLERPPVGAVGAFLRLVSQPARGGVRQGLAALVPASVTGTVVMSAGNLDEHWRVECDGPCLLDVLATSAGASPAAAGWNALPDGYVAAAWMKLDRDRLRASAAPAAVDALERLVGIPVRDDLGHALAGPVVAALLAEPDGRGAARWLVAADLARPDVARQLVERLLALGVLSSSLEVGHYRDVTVGSWIPRSGRDDLTPSIAVDGGLLLMATRRSDLLDAIDRRRRPRSRGSPPEPLAAFERDTPSAWRAWSRSPFVSRSWAEIVTGRRDDTVPGAVDVVAAMRPATEHEWILEGRGNVPAFAADPVLPALRSLARAARAVGEAR